MLPKPIHASCGAIVSRVEALVKQEEFVFEFNGNIYEKKIRYGCRGEM